MTERILMEGKLGELLTKIAEIKDPPEGFYLLYVADFDKTMDEDLQSAILLSLHDEDEDFVPDEALERDLLAIAIVRDVQSVVEVALEDKPDASLADLVKALEFYLDHDGFIDLQ